MGRNGYVGLPLTSLGPVPQNVLRPTFTLRPVFSPKPSAWFTKQSDFHEKTASKRASPGLVIYLVQAPSGADRLMQAEAGLVVFSDLVVLKQQALGLAFGEPFGDIFVKALVQRVPEMFEVLDAAVDLVGYHAAIFWRMLFHSSGIRRLHAWCRESRRRRGAVTRRPGEWRLPRRGCGVCETRATTRSCSSAPRWIICPPQASTSSAEV